jgi:MFS family permease
MFQASVNGVPTFHEIMKHWRDRLAAGIGLDDLPAAMRPLAWGGSTSAVGSGMWFTIWALFLTERVGLPGPQAGIALTIAGVVGFVCPAPLGRLADRRGPREVYGALLAAEGVAVAGFLLCHTFLEVVLVASATAACDQGKTGVRAALITQMAPGDQRVGALACLRACSHAGHALGAGLGALVIGVGTGHAYAVAILFNAISYLAYAAALRGVPHVAACAAATRAVGRKPLPDLPFLALAATCGVLTLCWGLMSAGLPLWIAGHTRAPHAVAGIMILISSIAIAGLQVTFSRGVETPRAAAGAALRSGLSLALCCGLVALAAVPAALPATLLLLGGGVAHVLGELWFAPASWGLSVPFMRPDRAAEDQGIFATGEALAIMLAPALMSAVVVPGGAAAWLGLGAVFAVAGASARPAARWAAGTGHPAEAALSA